MRYGLMQAQSDFTSKVVEQLTKYLGIHHIFSLVDRHESCGVEGTNKQILRHVKALVIDKSTWSDDINLTLVLFVINDEVNSETGVLPLDAMFGSSNGPYLQLPKDALSSDITVEWIKALDANLKSVRDKSSQHQDKLIESRISKTPVEKQNVYHPGDLVLWQQDPTKPLPNKLASHFKGPYEVIAQYKNDVECRHVVMKNIQTVPVNRLKMFHGKAEDGYKAALHDANQANIVKIHD